MPAHAYQHPVTGEPIPSVSSILAQLKQSDVRGIDMACTALRRMYEANQLTASAFAELLAMIRECSRSGYSNSKIEEAAQDGDLTHSLVERALRGEDVVDVPDRMQTAWSNFQKWVFENDIVPETTPDGRPAVELPLTTPPNATIQPFGGCLDFVVRIGGRRVLVDLKNRSASDGKLAAPDHTCYTQVSAYTALWDARFPSAPIDAAMVLIVARNAAVPPRECWLTREHIQIRQQQFWHLLGLWAVAEAAEPEVKAMLKASRDAHKGKAA